MPLRAASPICDFVPMILPAADAANGDQPCAEQPCARLTIAAALTLVPTAAFAHPGIGEMHGFTHGFAHPLGGLDHMLAMVTVGIFAWQLGGRALWLVPAAFVARWRSAARWP